MVLKFLRTSPVPRTNPAKPLAPGSPPAAQLPLNPLEYLRVSRCSHASLHSAAAQGGHPMGVECGEEARVGAKWEGDVCSQVSFGADCNRPGHFFGVEPKTSCTQAGHHCESQLECTPAKEEGYEEEDLLDRISPAQLDKMRTAL